MVSRPCPSAGDQRIGLQGQAVQGSKDGIRIIRDQGEGGSPRISGTILPG